MGSSGSKQRRTVPAAESTPISLHAADCTESPEDLQRMRDLIQEDPSLLYKVQPNPIPENDAPHEWDEFKEDYIPAVLPLPNIDTPPLWHACEAQHLACVNLILQASAPENIKPIKICSLSYPSSSSSKSEKENVISYSLNYGKEDEKSYEIVKSLLEHGVSPNVEIPVSEISKPEILQVLEQYKTTKLIFPSHTLHMAVKEGYSKILELLFEHGAYPDPVILTESGSILPLYPTLGKHLHPIPAIQHPDIEREDILAPLFDIGAHYNITLRHVESIKMLFVYGAMVPLCFTKDDTRGGSRILPRVLFPLDVIISFGQDRDSFNIFFDYHVSKGKVTSDAIACSYCDIILALLKLYHQFGGSLWWKMKSRHVPCEGGTGECVEWLRNPSRVTPCKGIIQIFEESIEDPEDLSLLVGEVQRMISTPHSLQHSARLAIRRSMGYGCVRNLEALPLPDQLKKYLKFETEYRVQ